MSYSTVHAEIADRTFSMSVPEGRLTLRAVSDEVIEVKVVPPGAVPKYESVTIQAELPVKATLTKRDGETLFSTGKLTVAVDAKTGRVRFMDAISGKVLLAEAGRRFFKTVVTGEDSWTPEQAFDAPADESLYGLGQHQDGRLDWRGETICLRQANTEASVPFIWSTRGYGLLWDNPSETWLNPGADVPLEENKGVLCVAQAGRYSLWLDHGAAGPFRDENTILVNGEPVVSLRNYWMTPGAGGSIHLEAGREYAIEVRGIGHLTLCAHRMAEPTTVWRSKAGEAVDYYFIHGANPEEMIANYRAVSGHAPMLPKYAFGFWQCRERYESSKELIDTIEEFRKRQIPIDVIVQDWEYWGKYGWNAMKWDEDAYPDIPALTGSLHGMNARFLVSVWPKFDRGTEVWKALKEIGGIVGDTEWFDPTSPQARALYWDFSKKAFLDQGVDGYWQDAAEPDDTVLEGNKLQLGTGDRYLNSYPLFVNRAVYEGQRAVTDTKRVCILTRCAYAGQQRYGTIVWSGDVNSSWDSFHRQIAAGLGFVSSGIPYWTYDAGGFFRNDSDPAGMGNPSGQYDSDDFREKLVRWVQCAALLPVMRIHGYQSHTEPWHYGTETEEILTTYIRLRYQLLPYLYSQGWQVHLGGTLMRPLGMEFPGDVAVRKVADEFMCGPALLVAPVTTHATSRNVVLPAGVDWCDFWTGEKSTGGQVKTVSAPLGTLPLFVRAGSILPFGPVLQYSGEKTDKPCELRIYPGADATFDLYDDAGDGYGYENGELEIIPLKWNDAARTLTLGARQGTYPGMSATRSFAIRLLKPNGTWSNVPVLYDGSAVAANLGE